MATVSAVIQGKQGSTPYFMAKMTARELVSTVRPPSETEDWLTMTLEERMQRDLNYRRVEDEIVPYLLESPDRFFGAFVVLIYRGKVTFEPLSDISPKIPAAYKSVAQRMGFLTIDGGELIVLDGQHRLWALRTVIQGQLRNKEKVVGKFFNEVPNDEMEVIFVEFDPKDQKKSFEKIRRIFNKLNRYAKSTGRSDNIITSEDDIAAVLTRRLLRDTEPLGVKVKNNKTGTRELIVNWNSNTISTNSKCFTTISAVYETVKVILTHEGVTALDERKNPTRPRDDKLDEWYVLIHEWWEAVIAGVAPIAKAFADPDQLVRMRSSDSSLLFKPAAHIVLFMALSLAIKRGLALRTAIEHLNDVDWTANADMWKHVLILPNGRISARKENYDVSAELLAYLISADKLSEEGKTKVRESVRGFRNDSRYVLPNPVQKKPSRPKNEVRS